MVIPYFLIAMAKVYRYTQHDGAQKVIRMGPIWHLLDFPLFICLFIPLHLAALCAFRADYCLFPFLSTFMVCHEDTCTRCEKYQSKLHISYVPGMLRNQVIEVNINDDVNENTDANSALALL